MKIVKLIYFIGVLIAFNSSVWADSPLTSTDFYKAYSAHKIVIAAKKSDGILTDNLQNYLLDKKTPIAVKMAAINQLGWSIEGKNNSAIFLNFVLKKYNYSDKEEFLQKGRADDLLSIAYLKALDNYFDVKEAAGIAKIALKKNSKSRTFNLIHGLIKAQIAMDGNWCEVYQITNRIKNNSKLKNDLKPQAVRIIYEYMDGYKSECK